MVWLVSPGNPDPCVVEGQKLTIAKTIHIYSGVQIHWYKLRGHTTMVILTNFVKMTKGGQVTASCPSVVKILFQPKHKI